MAMKGVGVALVGASITIDPWIQTVSKSAGDFILWSANNNCKIKIEPVHPEHFNPRLEDKYKKNVRGYIDAGATEGTYKYCISVLEDSPGDAAVYHVDPDYKVDR